VVDPLAKPCIPLLGSVRREALREVGSKKVAILNQELKKAARKMSPIRTLRQVLLVKLVEEMMTTIAALVEGDRNGENQTLEVNVLQTSMTATRRYKRNY
jgi:hypothetical protein